MSTREELIAQILKASGGRIVGRIRLQKMIYLLQQLGLGSDFKFSYHHYGPYSEEASTAVQRAAAIGKLIKETETPLSYGGFYSEFELVAAQASDRIGNLAERDAKQFASLMKAETSVVLELAATIHWLKSKEKVSDWEKELRLRKPGKASQENTARAKKLLSSLGLAA